MQKKFLVTLALITLVSGMVSAYDCDWVENDVGDARLVSIAGFMFSKPLSIELLPATEERAACSISCQIIYKDSRLGRPDDSNWEQVLNTCELLSDWLKQYVQKECEGEDLETLCSSYASRSFVRTLQSDFADYVRERIKEMPSELRIDVDAVTVQVQANEAFGEEIRRRMPPQQ